MTDIARPRVSRAAYLLGFAGLLPQVAAVGLMAFVGDSHGVALGVAGGYASLILSFLGGIWWGFAMRRSAGQGRLAALAVVPSLAALAISYVGNSRIGLVALGSAILLTLPVDRHLVRTGEAPPDWMRLRVPLSLGLGGLTILAGVLAA